MRKALLFLFISSILLATEQSEKRLKLAILNLKNASGVSQGEAELISDRLRNEFFSTGIVDVMERDQMQEVMKEQGFQQSGNTCNDEGCMVEIGRMLGVKLLVAGSIGKLGTMFMVNVRSINVETGRVERVVSKDVKGVIEDVVAIIPSIARKIAGVRSVVEPTVIEIVSDTIQKDITEDVINEIQEVVSKNALPCDGSYYMESLDFSSELLGFDLQKSVAMEISEELSEELSDALDKDVIIASGRQIISSNCKTKVIRIKLNSYKTRPAAFNQFEGTANISISIFDSPHSSAPLVSVNIEKTGDRHWGKETPFENAFEEISDALDRSLRSKVKQYLK